MAYNSKSFSVAAYTNGFTLWSYGSEDKLDEIMEPDYFRRAAAFVRRGDMILTNADKEGDMQSAILVVSEAGGEKVAVKRLV
jgi:hypothetical protein